MFPFYENNAAVILVLLNSVGTVMVNESGMYSVYSTIYEMKLSASSLKRFLNWMSGIIIWL